MKMKRILRWIPVFGMWFDQEGSVDPYDFAHDQQTIVNLSWHIAWAASIAAVDIGLMIYAMFLLK